MRRGRGGPGDAEAGFTLIELLAVVAILGVISFALTEAVILGLKTTDGTAKNVSQAIAVQALQSYFTSDVQSAQQASTLDTSCANTAVVIHLSWIDQGKARDVSYSLEPDSPPTAGQRELVRWSCTAGGSLDKRMLGLFSFDPAGPLPVVALCEPACSDPPVAFATVTLKVLTPAAVDLTVGRRTT